MLCSYNDSLASAPWTLDPRSFALVLAFAFAFALALAFARLSPYRSLDVTGALPGLVRRVPMFTANLCFHHLARWATRAVTEGHGSLGQIAPEPSLHTCDLRNFFPEYTRKGKLMAR